MSVWPALLGVFTALILAFVALPVLLTALY